MEGNDVHGSVFAQDYHLILDISREFIPKLFVGNLCTLTKQVKNIQKILQRENATWGGEIPKFNVT